MDFAVPCLSEARASHSKHEDGSLFFRPDTQQGGPSYTRPYARQQTEESPSSPCVLLNPDCTSPRSHMLSSSLIDTHVFRCCWLKQTNFLLLIHSFGSSYPFPIGESNFISEVAIRLNPQAPTPQIQHVQAIAGGLPHLRHPQTNGWGMLPTTPLDFPFSVSNREIWWINIYIQAIDNDKNIYTIEVEFGNPYL